MINNNRKSKKRAQGLTEYVIVVVLVAICCLAAVQAFGGTVRTKFEESNAEIGSNLNTTSPPVQAK